MKKGERLVILGILLVSLFCVFFFRRGEREKATVGFYLQDELYMTFDASKDQTISLSGMYGDMTVEVKDGAWHVAEVECPNHICEKMGWKTEADPDPIVCMPNGIVIMVTDDAE